jgi:hypothetical protein
LDNNTQSKNHALFRKLKNTDINGRNLELFMPLLIIALNINEKTFELCLEIFNNMAIEKKDIDYYESTDIKVYEFISELKREWNLLKNLLKNFKEFSEIYEEWTNPKWFSRELHKLNLVFEQKRMTEGFFVKLNINKAKEKLKIFKE